MDFTKAIEDNLHDHLFVSNFDRDSFKGIDLCLGIDEAGRGPVLGPMVYGALFCPIDKEKQLKEMKCADSKSLSEKDRESIFERINEENKICGFAVKSLSPNTISTGMLGRIKYNLNELSHDTAISLIDVLCNQENLNITHVYLDTVGDPHKYELKLSKRFPKLKIKVAKKADSLYPCVSAASICAKVTRDNLLKNWIFRENCSYKEYGSGYPGDPLTKKFLDSNLNNVFGFVKLVRFSWSTAGIKVKKSCVAVKWPDAFDENDDGDDEIIDCTEENDQVVTFFFNDNSKQ
ncbi:ribonuclease H2 subunit A [Brachionus plicatilis]|uniref:Ribonuclease n=1 Tax=Brachionus plicatilis TaxID=10195 RepID=A0A3M7PAD9_BRAPC|nr:ribonuclease H2 subunit A [Brachionus plicatilis]